MNKETTHERRRDKFAEQPLGQILPEGECRFPSWIGQGKPGLFNLALFENAEEIDSHHLLDQFPQWQVALGVVPSIDPVHHPEEGKSRCPEIYLSVSLSLLQLFNEIHEDLYITTLQHQHLLLESAR